MRDYTVKDIADLLGVSKPTIQRAINTAAIEPDKEERQKRYYSYDKTVSIIKLIAADFDFSLLGEPPQTATETAKPQQETETETAKPQQEPPQTATETAKPQQETAKPQQSEELELLRSVVKTLQEQITIKDKQIEDYAARLKEALELTKGQQYLSAADKQVELLEAAAVPEGEEVAAGEDEIVVNPAANEKKSFWQRLFGKK